MWSSNEATVYFASAFSRRQSTRVPWKSVSFPALREARNASKCSFLTVAYVNKKLSILHPTSLCVESAWLSAHTTRAQKTAA